MLLRPQPQAVPGGLEGLLDRVPAQDPSHKLKSSKHYNRQKHHLYDHRGAFRGSCQGNTGSFTLPGGGRGGF